MAIPSTKPELPPIITNFIKDMRENRGRKVQAVVYDHDADYEGIISVSQGYRIEDTLVPPEGFVAYVAGMTAGAAVTQSNAYHVIPGATDILGPLTDAEIEEAMVSGKMVLSRRQDGAIVIEKDINTLHTFAGTKSYDFSKNRVIRCLDDIANQAALVFETKYIGKVDNNEKGRTILKADLIGYFNQLQDMGAIRDFDSGKDIQVLPGNDIESVIVNIGIFPVDAMEKMYMTVTLQ